MTRGDVDRGLSLDDDGDVNAFVEDEFEDAALADEVVVEGEEESGEEEEGDEAELASRCGDSAEEAAS